MSIIIQQNNQWKTPTSIYLRKNNQWALVKKGYVYNDNQWKLFFEKEVEITIHSNGNVTTNYNNNVWRQPNFVDTYFNLNIATIYRDLVNVNAKKLVVIFNGPYIAGRQMKISSLNTSIDIANTPALTTGNLAPYGITELAFKFIAPTKILGRPGIPMERAKFFSYPNGIVEGPTSGDQSNNHQKDYFGYDLLYNGNGALFSAYTDITRLGAMKRASYYIDFNGFVDIENIGSWSNYKTIMSNSAIIDNMIERGFRDEYNGFPYVTKNKYLPWHCNGGNALELLQDVTIQGDASNCTIQAGLAAGFSATLSRDFIGGQPPLLNGTHLYNNFASIGATSGYDHMYGSCDIDGAARTNGYWDDTPRRAYMPKPGTLGPWTAPPNGYKLSEHYKDMYGRYISYSGTVYDYNSAYFYNKTDVANICLIGNLSNTHKDIQVAYGVATPGIAIIYNNKTLFNADSLKINGPQLLTTAAAGGLLRSDWKQV